MAVVKMYEKGLPGLHRDACTIYQNASLAAIMKFGG